MSEKHYVKLAVILEKCFEIEADSPDDAINKVNDSIENFGGSIDEWELIDYNIEVQDDDID